MKKVAIKKVAIGLFCLLAAGIAHADPASVDACLDDRIQTFRQLEGPNAPIRMDVLGEWEAECQNDAGKVVDPVQACVEKRIDEFRRIEGENAPIRMDIIGEWEAECR